MILCQNKVCNPENLILTKFHNDWVEFVDFLIKAYFDLNYPGTQSKNFE